MEDMLDEARRASENARAVRDFHAKRNKRGSRQRETDIRLALERLRDAMRPIRRAIARLPYSTAVIDAEALRSASQDLQKERRKLWKMRGTKRKRKN
jgi:hypothetical protein